MANKVKIKLSEQRKLHAKSGNRCALCGAVLVDADNSSAACIGENAHIYGEKKGAARYDASKDEEFVNSEENLIFLCCSCHKKIDTDVDSYPVEKLLSLKKAHEKSVIEHLAVSAPNYSFAELEVLVNYLIGTQSNTVSMQSYSLLNISDKISKNALQDVQGFLNIGLINIETIQDYLNRNPDTFFANKLTNAIVEKYNELKQQGVDNISVFYELWSYVSGRKDDYNYKSAGLGIVTYFFEKCEVFEK